MRAAVMNGQRISVEDVDDPTPGPGQVVIAPEATGICGSDLHMREAYASFAQAGLEVEPIIPGHEFAGRIVALGSDVDAPGGGTGTGTGSGTGDQVLRVGDFVTAIPFTHGPDGPEGIGLSPRFGGGLAEFVLADATSTFVLPESIHPDRAGAVGALAEPLAVGLRALSKAAPQGPIVVVGTGPIGLMVIAAAVLQGRGPVIAVDPSEQRRDVARRVGAHSAHAPGASLVELLGTVGYRPSTMSPLLREDPEPATIVECVGRPEVIETLLTQAPAHSRVVLAGACIHSLEMPVLQLTLAEVAVETSFAYRPADFVTSAQLLGTHPEIFSSMITAQLPLAETEHAFALLENEPEQVKILINPNA
ncbi:MAG TPA: zinc-binding dehydrogenase [Microthrixaceae bacterium]|nr:zinc-binding dehydrogenase [Microthrixaceae bacterium]